jgi:hypothetical protein
MAGAAGARKFNVPATVIPEPIRPIREYRTMKQVFTPTGSMRGFAKQAKEILAELQKTLLPEHASKVIAINVNTGDYLLANTRHEAWQEFRKRWPGTLGYVCRVDGGPVVKFYGRWMR